MGIFNFDGKLYKLLVKFWNLVLISVLWIVCSIPIFTIGASCAAAYYACVKSVRSNEDTVMRDFFKAFKQNFKQSVVMTLVYLVIGFFITVATVFYYHQSGSTALGLRWIFYLIVLIYLCTLTYAFAWLSRFEMTVFHAITYPFAIALIHLKNSLGLIVFWAAAIICSYWAYNTFLFIPLIIMIPGIMCLLDTFMIEPVMKKYEPMARQNESKEASNAESDEGHFEAIDELESGNETEVLK